jgi:uncharacterized protein with WD repeat
MKRLFIPLILCILSINYAVATARQEQSAAFSPDGKYIVSGTYVGGEGKDYEYIKIFDATTGQAVKSLSTNDDGKWIAFSPDGKTIISVNYGSMELKFWDTATGRNIGTFVSDSKISGIAYSSNGSFISCMSGSTVKIIDAKTRQLFSVLNSDSDVINSFDFSPDREWLVASSYSFEDQSVVNSKGETEVKRFRINDKIQIWDIKTGDILWQDNITNNGSADRVVFMPDSIHLIVSVEYKLADNEFVTNLILVPLYDSSSAASRLLSFDYRIGPFQIHPNGRYIIIPISDTQVEIWDMQAKHKIRILEGSGTINISLSLDGSMILAVSRQNHIINTWDFRDCI